MANITEKILDVLKGSAKSTVELSKMMLCTRPESYRRLRDSMTDYYPLSKKKNNLADKQNFYSMLNYLKREGFVKRNKVKEETVWVITKDGIEKLNKIRISASNSRNNIAYTKKRSNRSTIFAFDIPERLGKNRAWLREVLKYLGFVMVQKSLWIGACGLPEEFLFDLRKRGLIDCIDIFEVGSKGTLCRIDLERGR